VATKSFSTVRRVLIYCVALAAASAIALAAHLDRSAQIKIYPVEEIASVLTHNPGLVRGHMVNVRGREAFGVWMVPVPGSAPRHWRTGNLAAPSCLSGMAAGCPPPGVPLAPWWFVAMRLVPVGAGSATGNPFTWMTHVPGIWIKVPPFSSWRDHLHTVPGIGPLLPLTTPPTVWGATGTYRLVIRRSCAAFLCSDAVLAE